MMYLRTLATILRTEDGRGADRLFSFYTRDWGKIVARGSGVREQKSKRRGMLLPYGFVDIILIPGKNQYHLADTNSAAIYPDIITSVEKMTDLGQVLKIANSFLAEGEKDQDLWGYWQEIFDFTDSVAPDVWIKKRSILRSIMVLKLLEILGYAPWVLDCVYCHRDLADGLGNKITFSFAAGGARCQFCGRGGAAEMSFDINLIKLLRLNSVYTWSDWLQINAGQGVLADLERFVEYFLKSLKH